MKSTDSIYLDHAAGTFLLPEVRNFISRWLDEQTGNPSSIHAIGRQTAGRLDFARQGVAAALHCKPSEIIFTSGGSEANNLAILGLAHAHADQGKHLITCRTEHPSVLESFRLLEQEGFTVTYLASDSHGQIDLETLKASITKETTLISLMWVNNETGLIHPIQEIANIAEENGVRFHCDAVQALGHFPIQANKLNVDTLSFSGHKIGAPAGIGVLYLRKGTSLIKSSYGGNQENNQRAGTQNILGALTLAQAMGYQHNHLEAHRQHFETLKKHLQEHLQHIPGIQINQGADTYSPHILNCSFYNVDGETLFIRLDMSDIAVSNGSACSSGSQAPSHVLTALGMERSLAQASLRISLGIQTTLADIDLFCDKLETIIHSIQRDSS